MTGNLKRKVETEEEEILEREEKKKFYESLLIKKFCLIFDF